MDKKSVTMKKEILFCEECIYSKTDKVYTADSFEDVRKVHCKRLNKDVYKYLDWNDKSRIPNECPFRNE